MSGYDYSDRRARGLHCPECGAESIVLLRQGLLYCHPHYRNPRGCDNPNALALLIADRLPNIVGAEVNSTIHE